MEEPKRFASRTPKGPQVFIIEAQHVERDEQDPDKIVGYTAVEHEFVTLPGMPAEWVREFLVSPSAAAMHDMVVKMTADSQREELKSLLDDPDTLVDASTVTDISRWLLAVFADRPTQASSPSGDGRSLKAVGSTDSDSSEGSTTTASSGG